MQRLYATQLSSGVASQHVWIELTTRCNSTSLNSEQSWPSFQLCRHRIVLVSIGHWIVIIGNSKLVQFSNFEAKSVGSRRQFNSHFRRRHDSTGHLSGVGVVWIAFFGNFKAAYDCRVCVFVATLSRKLKQARNWFGKCSVIISSESFIWSRSSFHRSF